MTVARMQAEMPNAEYVRWGVYLGRKAQQRELAEQRARAKGVKR